MNSLASVFIASSKFTFISSKGHPISMGFYTFFNIADFFPFLKNFEIFQNLKNYNFFEFSQKFMCIHHGMIILHMPNKKVPH